MEDEKLLEDELVADRRQEDENDLDLKEPVVPEEVSDVKIPEVLDVDRSRSLVGPRIERDEDIARQVRVLGRYGLSKAATRVAVKIEQQPFERLYADDYYEGQAEMQKRLASLAMDAAEAGSVPMIMYLCKTKLGWNETNVVEHIGEVRNVVSAKPMSRAEFEARYLNQDKEGSED